MIKTFLFSFLVVILIKYPEIWKCCYILSEQEGGLILLMGARAIASIWTLASPNEAYTNIRFALQHQLGDFTTNGKFGEENSSEVKPGAGL